MWKKRGINFSKFLSTLSATSLYSKQRFRTLYTSRILYAIRLWWRIEYAGTDGQLSAWSIDPCLMRRSCTILLSRHIEMFAIIVSKDSWHVPICGENYITITWHLRFELLTQVPNGEWHRVFW